MIQFSGEDLDWIVTALRLYANEYRKSARAHSDPWIAAAYDKQADQAFRLAMRIEREREPAP